MFSIRKDCSAARAHQAFVSLGLRHMLVVDSHSVVVGIITRKDLDHAAGLGGGWLRWGEDSKYPCTVLYCNPIYIVLYTEVLYGTPRSIVPYTELYCTIH